MIYLPKILAVAALFLLPPWLVELREDLDPHRDPLAAAISPDSGTDPGTDGPSLPDFLWVGTATPPEFMPWPIRSEGSSKSRRASGMPTSETVLWRDQERNAWRVPLRADEFFPAVVEPLRSVVLGAPAEAGIAEVLVADGQKVEAGDLLVRTHDEQTRAALEVAEAAARRSAAVRSAEHEVDLSRKYLARLESAKVKGATSEAKIDEARTRLLKAEALRDAELEKLVEARAVVTQQRSRLALHEVRAPFAGTVWLREATPGAMAGPGSELLVLHDLSSLTVEVLLPVRLLGRLEIGERYVLRAGAPLEADVVGVVTAIDPIVDAKLRTFRVRLLLQGPEAGVPAGWSLVFAQPGT